MEQLASMTAIETDPLRETVIEIARAARDAARMLATLPGEQKNDAIRAAAQKLRDQTAVILAANARDLAAAKEKNLAAPLVDRLVLDEGRIAAVAAGLDAIADLPDPVGSTIAEWSRPNGLTISRVRVPIGVIGIIYESRPNVTADTGALCLKSGNAAILRGGSESEHSSKAIAACMQEGLVSAGVPATAIQIMPTQDRAAVGHMLTLPEWIDIIVPRGGKSLTGRVQKESQVPVLAHLDGICHLYVDRDADLGKARAIAVNAKMRRTSICGAAETLLVDEAIAAEALPPLVGDLIAAGCAVRGDAATQAVDRRVVPATEADWGTEYLDAVISVRIVDGLEAAMAHIDHYGSHHTESIITENAETAARFLREVDSAIVMHNTSTQFADGGEFGMGAEIGISTGRLHARGPVGAEQLTSFKYAVRSNGQVRP